MTTYFVAWQSPDARGWFPIGRLTRENGRFRFVYTKGAEEAKSRAGFRPLQSFPDLHAAYVSDSLFPLLSNRLPSPSRPDFLEYMRWLNLPEDTRDPLVILSLSGGKRMTDSFEIFLQPEPDEGDEYHIRFFAHGLRYFPPESIERISRLEAGDVLLLVWDWQNPHDRTALALRTNDNFHGDRFLVGFCPRYLCEDVLMVFREHWGETKARPIQVTVVRVNPPPAPLQVRLLCTLTAVWPEGFHPFSGPAYEPLAGPKEGNLPPGR